MYDVIIMYLHVCKYYLHMRVRFHHCLLSHTNKQSLFRLLFDKNLHYLLPFLLLSSITPFLHPFFFFSNLSLFSTSISLSYRLQGMRRSWLKPSIFVVTTMRIRFLFFRRRNTFY